MLDVCKSFDEAACADKACAAMRGRDSPSPYSGVLSVGVLCAGAAFFDADAACVDVGAACVDDVPPAECAPVWRAYG